MVRRDVSELGARARAGDPEAFAELYRIYLPDVRAYCQRRLGDPLRAEDLAQDVFERAWRSIARFDGRRTFWPWLQVIASNLLIDEHRRGAIVHLERLEGSAAETIPSNEDVEMQVLVSERRAELLADLRVAFARLSPRAASIAWQRHSEDVSYEQLAARYTTSTASIRNTTWKATALLRTALKEAGWRAGGCVAIAFGLLQRLHQRVRAGATWVQSRVEGSADVSAHGAAVMALGLVIVVGSFSNDDRGGARSPRPGARVTVPAAWAGSTPARDGAAYATASSGGGRWGPIGRSTPRVEAEVRRRDGAVAPTETRLVIEIHGQDGTLLYRGERYADCEQVDSQALPKDGPVRAWC